MRLVVLDRAFHPVRRSSSTKRNQRGVAVITRTHHGEISPKRRCRSLPNLGKVSREKQLQKVENAGDLSYSIASR
jgi:hypothetical protein